MSDKELRIHAEEYVRLSCRHCKCVRLVPRWADENLLEITCSQCCHPIGGIVLRQQQKKNDFLPPVADCPPMPKVKPPKEDK